MSTMNRRYRSDVPINLTSEEEPSNNSAKNKEETEKIQMKVVRRSNSNREEEDQGVFNFNIDIDLPLRWVMIWYYQELGLDLQTTRFEFNGRKLRETDTPRQLGMLHHDCILAFPIPTQGSSLRTIWPSGPRLTLTVKCLSGNVTTFIVTPKTLLGQIMDRLVPPFAESVRSDFRFIYNGRQLSATNTVEEVGITDGSVICSMLCLRGC